MLDRMADLFSDLPQWRPQMAERARELKSRTRFAERAKRTSKRGPRSTVELRLSTPTGWDPDGLIGEQFWRVAFHRVAEDEINYRRFFNINDLAGLRMEIDPVFAHAHARVFRMLESEEIDGLRIDHIDGLFDPKAYLDGLRSRRTSDFLSGRRKRFSRRTNPRAPTGRSRARLATTMSTCPLECCWIRARSTHSRGCIALSDVSAFETA